MPVHRKTIYFIHPFIRVCRKAQREATLIKKYVKYQSSFLHFFGQIIFFQRIIFPEVIQKVLHNMVFQSLVVVFFEWRMNIPSPFHWKQTFTQLIRCIQVNKNAECSELILKGGCSPIYIVHVFQAKWSKFCTFGKL